MQRNFCIGDVVLLKEENMPRNRWPTTRVIETFPNKDGLIRSVNLKVASSGSNGKITVLKRPINKLVLLVEADPISIDEEVVAHDIIKVDAKTDHHN